VRRALPIAVVPLALIGCGNERTAVPDVRHADAPKGTHAVRLGDGTSFRAPANWSILAAEGARSGGVQSKTATLAVWRYPRSEPLPETAEELDGARTRLEQRITERDTSFELTHSEVNKRAGADAIELIGRETIAGLPFGVRSTHVFKGGQEVVVDAYAPPEDFERVDSTVFEPAIASLELP
jgi:hypothetical protein